MGPYDLIKAFFLSDREWEDISPVTKRKNFFMVNRVMSIQYPLQGQLLNNTRISSEEAIDWWRMWMKRIYTRPPKWCYTSTKGFKKDKVQETPPFVLSDETSLIIREKFQMSKRELKELEKFFPQDFEKWAKRIEEAFK
jgi:hypothetical protein